MRNTVEFTDNMMTQVHAGSMIASNDLIYRENDTEDASVLDIHNMKKAVSRLGRAMMPGSVTVDTSKAVYTCNTDCVC